ncbi:FkbM family methyltransferase [Brucella sp. IR073]|uniref:FkbM family methyltransferase n=1 Tax=unclassified Brucella TaxID=2632610 RepID=UPI003B986418
MLDQQMHKTADLSAFLHLPVIHSLVPSGEPISLTAYYPSFADYYPEAELQTKRWFVEHASRDWIIADIGANVGMYTLLFSRLAPEGRVHAFEPTQTAELLRRNIEAAGCENVFVHQVALGAVEGAREEPIYRLWGSAPEKQVYDFITLDAFVAAHGINRLDCIKIDVDGFDLEVLKGAAQTLRRFNPWLLVEINHALATRGQSVSEALLWLAGQGYTSALVLDQDNFLLKRGEGGTPGTLSLTFDRDPILMPAAFAPGNPLPDLLKEAPAMCNGAGFRDDGVLRVPGPNWSYAASWPVTAPPPLGPLVIDVTLEVLSGTVGIGCLADMTTYLGKEVAVSMAPGLQTARVTAFDGAEVRHVILRSNESEGRESLVRVHSLSAAQAIPATTAMAPLLRAGIRHFNLDQVADPSTLATPARDISILPVSELGAALGFAAPYVPKKMLYRYAPMELNSEVADIYRFFYRQFQPSRHLEFGTREGVGVVLCAESCDAEIWTVNLPGGERGASGAPLYSDPGGDIKDAGHWIGWRYREAGFSDRVHQLLMDSRDLPVSEFGEGFFDSILIDGGHEPDVVASDTDKALNLARSGGLIMWHDFCPEPETFKTSTSVNGVVRAWNANYDRWRPKLDRLYWLRPSWLLIGIRK